MDLVTWLEKNGCYEVEPVRVKIGRLTYEGARYKQDRTAPAGSRAALEGRADYTAEALYLLGPLPAAYQRTSRVCFTGVDEREWYVSGWVSPSAARDPLTRDYHFDGNQAVMLAPWFLDEKIDQHEETPYRRVRVHVEQ